MHGRVFLLISAVAVIASMALAGAAFAQSASPAQAVYNNSEVLGQVNGGGPADVVPNEVPATAGGGNSPHTTKVPTTTTREAGASTPSTPAVETGSLPFTGFEAGIVAFAGLALLGTGLAMRRVARRNDA